MVRVGKLATRNLQLDHATAIPKISFFNAHNNKVHESEESKK